jgi:hypothetical protein
MTRSTWAWPLVIAGCSIFGLVVALLGDGWLDLLSAAALAAPALAVIWAMRPRRA